MEQIACLLNSKKVPQVPICAWSVTSVDVEEVSTYGTAVEAGDLLSPLCELWSLTSVSGAEFSAMGEHEWHS